MPHPLSKTLVLKQADGTAGEKYDVVVDEDGKLQWWEESVGEGGIAAGDPVWRKWSIWGGGMGEITDLRQGGYYYSKNCYVGNPWAIRPRPKKNTVTLTDNATPVVRFFEAESASGTKYLYALAPTKVYKVRLSDMTLVNIKDLSAATVQFKTGSYTGDGSATRAITGLGFTPTAVMIKSPDYGTGPAIRVTGMVGGKLWLGAMQTGAWITSLDADGFTVDASYNVSAKTYCWMAWADAAGYVDVGTYSGDGGATKAITGVGFQADVLWLWDNANVADTAQVVSRHSTHAADQTVGYGYASTYADCISSLDADGFTVKNNTRVNASGHTYYYIAFKAVAGFCAVGTYAGNGVDDRDITGVGFDPEYAVVSRYGTSYSVHRSNYNAGDLSMYFNAGPTAANLIQELITDGFQVGTEAPVNLAAGTPTYHWIAFRSMSALTPTLGQPGKWNGIWEVPRGNDLDWVGLTLIADGTADDVWTPRVGLKATHFCRMHNKLARAKSGREIDLCAADDVSNADNWGADYPVFSVGQSGSLITELVEWQDELAVITEDGFYMFDGVAVAVQQLPLMGGISHKDNGKGSINWMLNILVGTADGFLRWLRDASPQGPDAIPGYVNAEDTSDEPVHLHHYGSAFLQDWIFNAAKDPSNNYHIFTLRPQEEGFKWDGLLTDTLAITMLFVDSDRRLFFNYGNNIAYIELQRGGEPGAAEFGEASGTGSFLLPEVTLADGADVSLRVVKVITRNMPRPPLTESGGVISSEAGPGGGLAAKFVAANARYLMHADHAALSVGDIYWDMVVWVKVTTPADTQGVVFKGVDLVTGSNYEYCLRVSSSKFVFSARNIAHTASANVTATTFGNIPANTWCMVHVYHDPVANVIGIGVNAGAHDTIATTGGVRDNTADFKVGRVTADGMAWYLDGGVGPIAIWKPTGTNLTAAQLTWLYNGGYGRDFSGLGTSEMEGLCAWWQMDEVSGTRTGDIATTFKWQVFASRDGGAAVQVGSDISADGVNKCYFAAASNLTARRLRKSLAWLAAADYVPTNDPPEVISIEVWGEAMPADAKIIRATVDLESDGIAQSTNYKALIAHENAGVRVLRHPITDEEMYVTVFKTQLFDIVQRDHEEATGSLMLHMRRGDTS